VSIFDALHAIGVSITPSSHPQQLRCPIHKGGGETNRSARVYPDSNSIYCFTCGRSYSEIGLLATYHGISAAAAAKLLYGDSPNRPDNPIRHRPTDRIASMILAIAAEPDVHRRLMTLAEFDTILVAASQGESSSELHERLRSFENQHFASLV
jgi:hypothetical protein